MTTTAIIVTIVAWLFFSALAYLFMMGATSGRDPWGDE